MYDIYKETTQEMRVTLGNTSLIFIVITLFLLQLAIKYRYFNIISASRIVHFWKLYQNVSMEVSLPKGDYLMITPGSTTRYGCCIKK